MDETDFLSGALKARAAPHPWPPRPSPHPHPRQEAAETDPYEPRAQGEDDEEEEALVRRIAWIEYYVSKGELDKARELGWSGDMSFLGLNEDGTPMAQESAPQSSLSQSNMHRI